MASDAATSASSSNYLDSSSFDFRSLLPTPTTSRTILPLASYDSQDSSSYEDDNNNNNNNNNTACCGWLPALTWRERCIGCATCMVAGYLLSLGSFWRISDLLFRGKPLPFVLNATIGNLIALAGSCFFSGPQAQLHKMFADKRKTATALYLSSLSLTLVVAFAPIPYLKGFLLLILMLVQYVAVAWYCLSYIPFAHDAVKSYLSHFMSRQGMWNDY